MSTDKTKELVSCFNAYKNMKKINEDGGAMSASAANAPADAMSSGPILDTSVNNPGSPNAVYVLFKDGVKKHFKNEIEMRDFMKKYSGWKTLKEEQETRSPLLTVSSDKKRAIFKLDEVVEVRKAFYVVDESKNFTTPLLKTYDEKEAREFLEKYVKECEIGKMPEPKKPEPAKNKEIEDKVKEEEKPKEIEKPKIAGRKKFTEFFDEYKNK